jgi:nucleoside-diphosphate-sugar epimerase
VEYIYHFVPRPHRAIHALIDIAVEQRARLIVCADDYFGHSEAIDEAAVGTAVRERGLDARIVRVLHCYGPRAHKGDDDITAMFEATLARRPLPIEGSGKQVRPMTYVADAIEGLLTVARRPPGALEPIDIVSTDEPSAIEIARTLARGVGRNFVYEYVGGHTASVDRDAPGCGDHVAFGVPPGTSLEAGLRKTYDWFTKESRLFV